MEPQFRFCTSADGTRIAYATYGSGPPLLYANTHVLSIDAQFQIPEARAYFEALVARVTLTMFDRRGSGASARDVEDLSAVAEASDIAAVAEAAALREFTLFSDIATTPAAMYVNANPGRVEKLLLWYPLSDLPTRRDSAARVRADWSYWRRLWASLLFPEGPVSIQRSLSKALKDTASQEMIARRFEALPVHGLRESLSAVSVPTMVLQREEWARQETIQLASLLPNGQVRFVPGHPATPYPDHEAIVDAVFDFMGLNDRETADASLPRGTTIILFTDIADSAALTERMGDTKFRQASRSLDDRVRAAIRDAGGTPVEGKVLGDGVMGVFQSAAQAIAAARRFVAIGGELSMHIGVHAGDVMSEGNNVYGGAVNIASRICGLCAPGEILVSQTVRDLARTSAGATFEDRGEHALKGIADPVRVFAVRAIT